jgi:hypothetical protein
MFNNSKIRFQRQAFKKQLKTASSHKRNTLKTKKGINLRVRTFSIAIAIFLIYILIFPNFLTIRTVEVKSGSQELQNFVQNKIQEFQNKSFLHTQKNLLLFSKSGFLKYISVNSPEISSLEISKKIPNTLVIGLKIRQAKYFLKNEEKFHVVSDDGFVLKTQDASTSSDSNLIPVEISAGAPNIEQSLHGQIFLDNLNLLSKKIPEITGNKIVLVKIDNFEYPDMQIFTKSGFKLLFDAKANLNEILADLKILYDQIPEADLKNLFYIDMRIKDKGYICSKNNPCSALTQNINNSIQNSTSTNP